MINIFHTLNLFSHKSKRVSSQIKPWIDYFFPLPLQSSVILDFDMTIYSTSRVEEYYFYASTNFLTRTRNKKNTENII